MELARENLAAADRIIRIVMSEKLNSTSFYAYSGITNLKVIDVKRGKSTFSNEEVISLKSEINKFRIELKQLISDLEKYNVTSGITESKFRKFIEKKYIKPAVVFPADVLPKFDGWKAKRRVFPEESKRQIINSLSILILETNV